MRFITLTDAIDPKVLHHALPHMITAITEYDDHYEAACNVFVGTSGESSWLVKESKDEVLRLVEEAENPKPASNWKEGQCRQYWGDPMAHCLRPIGHEGEHVWPDACPKCLVPHNGHCERFCLEDALARREALAAYQANEAPGAAQ